MSTGTLPLPIGGIVMTESNSTFSIEDCEVINTYPIQLRNGELVRDEWLSALEAQGYRVVRVTKEDNVAVGVNS